MKKILFVLCIMGIIIASSVAVCAEETVDVYVNGEKLITDQPAIIYQDRTMVPLRAICEELKCEVDWDGETQTALIENPICMISMQIDNYAIGKKDRRIEDGEQKNHSIDVAPILYNNRTLIPARAVAEALNATVLWNDVQKRVDINLEYDAIADYTNEYAIVLKNGKMGVIDKSGELTAPVKFEKIYDCDNELGLFRFAEGGNEGCIDARGNIVIPAKYNLVFPHREYPVRVMIEDEDGYWFYGFVDKNGKEVRSPRTIDERYVDAGDFVDGIAPVKEYNQGDWVYVDSNFIPVSNNFKDAQTYSENLTWVMGSNGHYGAINSNGETVIPYIYDAAEEFRDGIAIVLQCEDWESGIIYKWGAIDKQGNVVYPFEYMLSFGEDGEQRILRDKNGNIVFEQD